MEDFFSKVAIYLHQKLRFSTVANVYFKYFVRTAVPPCTGRMPLYHLAIWYVEEE